MSSAVVAFKQASMKVTITYKQSSTQPPLNTFVGLVSKLLTRVSPPYHNPLNSPDISRFLYRNLIIQF